jgi:tetratricopeptide (TPR) repeat protein
MKKVLLFILLTVVCSNASFAQLQFGENRDTYNKAVALINESRNLINTNQLQEAEDCLNKAITLMPNFAEARSNLGLIYYKRGKYNEAVSELQHALSLKPNFVPALLTLGATYHALGKNQESISMYKQYLSLNTNDEMAKKMKELVEGLEAEMILGKTNRVSVGSDYLHEAMMPGIGRWPSSRIPITVFIKTGENVPGYNEDHCDILKRSFSDWANASQGKISFVFVRDPNQARVICSWTDDSTKLASLAEGGHAHVVPDREGINHADILLYTKSIINDDPASKKVLHRLYLHEIGHALGLLGHSRDAGDIMFISVLSTDKEPSLSDRDRNTLLKLYSDGSLLSRYKQTDPDILAKTGDPKLGNITFALNRDGLNAANSGDYLLAEKKFEEAIKIDPKNELIRLNLGNCYTNHAVMLTRAKNLTEAEPYFKKAINIFQGTNSLQVNFVKSMTQYMIFLRSSKRLAEAAEMNLRINAVSEKLENSNRQ